MQLNVTWECSLYFHSAELVVRDLPTVVGSWVDQSPKKLIHSLERHPWKRFLPAKDVEELTWAVEVKIYGICKTSRRKKKKEYQEAKQNSLKCAGTSISEAKAEHFYECKICDELLRAGKTASFGIKGSETYAMWTLPESSLSLSLTLYFTTLGRRKYPVGFFVFFSTDLFWSSIMMIHNVVSNINVLYNIWKILTGKLGED